MHVLIRKLSALNDAEQTAIVSVLGRPSPVERGGAIVADGSRPDHSTVLLSGIACRHKDLPDGRRQILSFN
jgi:CRP-like cAMP-binding protein